MPDFGRNMGLYTDFYELRMAQGYFLQGWQPKPVVFDYFYRRNPFQGGYVIFAGLDDLLNELSGFSYDRAALEYLEGQGFNKAFLKYLADFRFRGKIFSVPEGEVVFPNQPLLRAEGDVIGCQLIESMLLNILNFESLIATKAARMRLAAGDRLISEFGLRRAQGYGAMQATRAALTGGCDNTSNTLAAWANKLSASGTMAHSWVQMFDSELDAFRAFAEAFPDSAILLVDTYDTIRSGLPHAIRVAGELRDKGHQLKGIRIDSGDLAWLSKSARSQLDAAGFPGVKIVVSNQLDEYLIRSLLEQNAPIDAFGVGTALVTGAPDASLDGVYKLSVAGSSPSMKLSENREKMTLPGRKELFRYTDRDSGRFLADGIELTNAGIPERIYHPSEPSKYTDTGHLEAQALLRQVWDDGRLSGVPESTEEIASYARKRLSMVPDEVKRFEYPHTYKSGIGPELQTLQNQMIKTL